MSSELRELYQEVILDHSKRPRNKRQLPDASASSEGFNPLCGDEATYVRIVFEPAWDQSMMSEAARLQLGFM